MSERDNAAYQIFNLYFRVAIPNLYLYSEDELTMIPIHNGFGSVSDEEIMQSERVVMMTIAKIADIRQEGAPVTFVKPNDGVKVYATIVRHLNDWKYIVSNLLSHPIPPLDDLTALEALAVELHPYVGNRATVSANVAGEKVKIGKPFMGKGLFSGTKVYDEKDINDYKPVMPALTNLCWRKYGHLDDAFAFRNTGYS